jgi:FSR family fosmidomycin resistance protein-like MFS transporter
VAERKGSSNSVYLAYLASTHFIIHVYTMLLPVLLLPLQEELGVSLVQVSLLVSIPRLLNVFIYIPAGVISDRYPSLVLTGSLVVTAAGAILVPLSRSFPLLLLGFTLLSVGSTLYHPPSLRMASEYDPKRMSLAMGIHNVGSNLGFSAGPLLLGYMMVASGWRDSFYVWAVLTVAMAALSYRYTRGNHRMRAVDSAGSLSLAGGLRSLLTRGFLLVILMSTFVEMTFNILVTYVPAYFTVGMGMTYSLTSMITGIGPLAGLVGSFLGGLAGVRYGNYKMAIVVLVASGAILFVFPGLTALWLVVAVYGLYRCLQAAFMPLMNSMIADNSDSRSRSLGFSLNFVVLNLFGSLSTTAASMLIEAYDTSVIFPLSIVLLIPTCLFIILLWRGSAGDGGGEP